MAELTFTHDEADDGPATSNFLATQESSAACINSLDTFEYVDGMGETLGVRGEVDCELEPDRSAELIGVHDITRYYAETEGAFEAQVQAAIDAGAVDGEIAGYSVEEAIALIAAAYSIPHEDAGTKSNRSRALAQFEYFFDEGSVLQFSVMKSEEDNSRNFIRYLSPTPYDISYIPATDSSAATYRYGEGMTRFAETSRNDVEEQYAELRWASPGEERLRYVLGAAYYEYDYLAEIYRRGGFNALSLGIEDDLQALTGASVEPNTTYSEFTENYALFFNASYDFSEKLTGSVEGRYALDKIGGRLESAPGVDPEHVEYRSFTPRVAVNYNPNDNMTFYLQYAVGINPGGINASMLDPDARSLLDEGVPVALDPAAPDTLTNIRSVNYDSSDYISFDEERLINYEFGFKGIALNRRLSYSGAVYHMIWENALQAVNLDWDYTYADDALAGQEVEGMSGLFYVSETQNTDARVSSNSGTSKTTGLEMQLGYLLNDSWSIDLGATLMRARHSDYCSASLYSGDDLDLGEIAELEESTDGNGNSCYVLNGKKLTRQPSVTISLTPRYRTEIFEGVQLNASARIQYTGKTYLDSANLTRTPARSTANITLGLSRDNWALNFYVENIFDYQTVSSVSAFEASRYDSLYVDTGVAPAAEESLFFRADEGGTLDYSHLSYRVPQGRTLGIRATYRF